MTKKTEDQIKHYNSREQSNLDKLNRNHLGSGLLLQLFKMGYTNVNSVLGLIIVWYPKYNELNYDTRFREFWTGQVRTQEMLDELVVVLKNVKKIRKMKNSLKN